VSIYVVQIRTGSWFAGW